MAENYSLLYEGEEIDALLQKIEELDDATASKSGLMSQADKTKLDGIATGAQVNVIESIAVGDEDVQISNKKARIVPDSAPTQDSTRLATSGGIFTAINNVITSLANYYLKTETYSKSEVNALVAAIKQFSYQVAETLPTASEDTMYIMYLIPSGNPEVQNVKDEFITVRSGVEGSYTYSWEQIGSTALDLSGYSTTEEMNAAIAQALQAYTTTAALTELLANKANVDGYYGGMTVGMANDITSWAGGSAHVQDTFDAQVRTTAGSISIDSSKDAGLMKIVAQQDFYASALRFTGKNLLRDAVAVGNGHFILVPALPFGEYGTANEPNGLLFVDSAGNNLTPAIRFKKLSDGVPTSVNDGVVCPYTDSHGLRFYNPAEIGFIIMPASVVIASTCARVAWSGVGFPYNQYVAADESTDAGFSINLATLIHTIHSYDLMLVAGSKADWIEKISDTQVRWHRVVDRVKPTWTTTLNEEGTYTHTATISAMKGGGEAECKDASIALVVSGTEVSYVDNLDTATSEYVNYELATEATGTANLDTEGKVEDFGLEKFINVIGSAYVTMQYARNYQDSLRALIDGELEAKVKDVSEKVDSLAEDVEDLLLGADDHMAAAWNLDQSSPVAIDKKGNDTSVDWDFFLVDHTLNDAGGSRPVGTLKRNNILRFKDGSFAPVVGITQEMYDECMANDLYIAGGELYAAAGTYDAKKFYDEHCIWEPGVGGVIGLIRDLVLHKGSADGPEVTHYLMPWETPETKYGIYIGRDVDTYYLQGVQGSTGKVWDFISTTPKSWDGKNAVKLAPSAFAPGPIAVIVDGSTRKSRPFFFAYDGAGAVYGAGRDGSTSQSEMFLNTGRTMPACSVMAQITSMQYARNNNTNAESPLPFAEGGWPLINAFISWLEIKYGTRYLHAAAFFGSGISSNDACNNEAQFLANGGVRCRKVGDTDWEYRGLSGKSAILTTNASQAAMDNWSNFLNRYCPKEACMESQLAASFAVEAGVDAGVEYEMYGKTYRWERVTGADDIQHGRMNAKVYSVRKETVNAFDTAGNAQSFEVECNLRMSLYEGANLSGDVYLYWGGGAEVVGTAIGTTTSRTGDPVEIYLEPDQSRWVYDTDTTKSNGGKFKAEAAYQKIGNAVAIGNGYSLRDMPLTPWKIKAGGGLGTGMCHYGYDSVYWSTTLGQRVRVGVRLRGYAYNGYCSPRNLTASNAASYTTTNYGGSAQVLLQGRATPVQPE